MTSKARRAAEAYTEHVNARQLDALLALFAPGAVVDAPTGDHCEGIVAIRAFYERVVFANGARVRPVRFVEEGDTCVMELVGVLESGSGPAPELVDVFTVDDAGSIITLRIFMRVPR